MTDKVSMGFCQREGAQDIVGRGGRGQGRELEAFVGSERVSGFWIIE